MTIGTSTDRCYRPSNGTEGIAFMEAWCGRCARDKEWSEGKPFDECGPGETCQIIADSMAYEPGHPKYPRAWTFDPAGKPICTAFVLAGSELPERDTATGDLFGGYQA